MAEDEVAISVRLRNAQKFARDTAGAARDLKKIGDQAGAAGRAARTMGGAFQGATATMNRGLGAVASQAHYAALGLGVLGAAGVKMGLSFNAQLESARLRFGLFTNDVDGLTAAVQKIDMTSAFSLGDLSDAAALLGNSGVKDVAGVLQATANAAAASGKGAQALNSIAIALSQIQSKGRLSQEEINQLNEAGAPGAQKIIADGFKLTTKQLQNLGGESLDATQALNLLTRAWTSGKMAKAAADQTKTLGGQWNLLTGNIQKLSGAATESLAAGLRDTAIPAVNEAVGQITRIFERDGLSNEQKLRQARAVIVRELGPVWADISDMIDEADIPDKLGDAVAAATPRVLDSMAAIAPKAAKAFVDGWLASGPEAQLITALFLGNKLRKSDLGKAIGGGVGGLGGAGRAPVPVFVTNPGFKTPDGPGGGGGGWRNVVKTAVTTTATVGSRFAPAAVPAAGVAYLAATHNENYATRGPGASSPSNPGGSIAPPGFGNNGGVQDISLTMDGRKLASVYAPYQQVEDGRLLASRSARK